MTTENELEQVKEKLENIEKITECQLADYINVHEFPIKLKRAQMSQIEKALKSLKLEGVAEEVEKSITKTKLEIQILNRDLGRE